MPTARAQKTLKAPDTAMLWFLTSSTLLMALAYIMPRRTGIWRRRAMETAMLLIAALPSLRAGMEHLGMQHLSLIPAAAAAPAGGNPWPAWLPSLHLPLGHAATFGQMGESPWLIAWAVGAGAGLLLLARRLAGLRHLRRSAAPLPPHAARHVAALLGLPGTVVAQRFRLCPQVTTPVVIIGLPSLVVLPPSWAGWPERLQRSALRHEWHHVLQKDAWWYFGARLFRILLWFHPLAWRLTESWEEECEHQADRAAVGAQDPADYADDLLGLAGRDRAAFAGALPWQGAPGFLGPRGSQLHRRVKSLLDPRAASARGSAHDWLIIPSALALILLTAASCAWTGIRPFPTSSSMRPPAEVQEAQLRLSANPFPAD